MDSELFFSNMTTAARQVIILYIIVAAGFICDRLGVFTQKTAKASNDLLFYVITPAVIINSFTTTEFTPDIAKGLILAAACGAVTHIIGILVSLPFFRDAKNPDNAIFKYAAIYGNMGYMALPLSKAMLGDDGPLYCSMGIAVFQIFSFTHGIWLMNRSSDGKKFNPKSIILNAGVIAVIIGIPLLLIKYFVTQKTGTQFSYPSILTEPLSYIGSMNTPLAMVMLGTYMANADIKTMFRNKQQYLCALIKIIITPVIALCVFRLVLPYAGLPETVLTPLLTSSVIQASAPSANNTVMFSAKYGKDTAIASKTVAFISFASVITMPVMIALSQL